MDILRGISAFVKAVDSGSIAAAARQLGITAAAASQNIARLEQVVGVRLLTRTTRSLTLTESGELYYAKVRNVVQDLEMAQADASALHGQAQGRLRIACSVAFGRHWLAPLMPAFMARFPRVAVEMILSDQSADHVRDDIDLSIRFKQQLEPGLVARFLCSVPMVFCAAPAYLARAGRPAAPEQLRDHACLLFRLPVDGLLMRWGFVREGVRFEPELAPSVVCNDIDTLAQLAVAGAGITRLGNFIAAPLLASGQLEALFGSDPAGAATRTVQVEPIDYYICYLDRKGVNAKMRACIDHLVQHTPPA